jgi:hypothetical protein
MSRIERFLLDAEKRFLPGQAEKRTEEARYRKLSADRKIADQKSIAYLAKLPLPSKEIPIQPLDDHNETTIQVFPVDESSSTALIIPGFDSTGQSRKYDWLIAELNRFGVGVARVNNQPHINLDPSDFSSHDEHTASHQEMYLAYMARHFQRIAAFLSETNQLENKQLYIIASSAAAPAALALYHLFEPIPQSMVLLGPSGDIDFKHVEHGINTFVQDEQRQIVTVAGQYDSFRKVEPFVTLSEMAHSLPNISATIVPGAEHDLRDENIKYLGSEKVDERTTRIFSKPEGGIIQLAIHRECLKTLGFSTNHLDEIVGQYPYVNEL